MLVITNGRAGTTDDESVEPALEVLRRAGPVTVVASADSAELDAVLGRHHDVVAVAVGGDGSLHALLDALHRAGQLESRHVGLIPLGTGNDFARGTGIPLDAVAAAELIVAGRARPVDLIADDAGGVVINAVHVGIGAQAARAALPFKGVLGPLAFPLGALLAGVTGRGQRLRVRIDGRLVSRGGRRVLMVAMSNASTIAGGTAILGPDAVVDDGRMDVTVSYSSGPLARLGFALHLHRGEHPGRDDVLHLRAREVTVAGPPFGVNADGELSDPVPRRRWTLQPHAWRFFLPDAP